MHSSDETQAFGDFPPSFFGASPTFADDVVFDTIFDYRCVPLTVDETLLEIELASPGPEAIRLLDTLRDRPLNDRQALESAAAWERQARWMSARQQAANVVFVDQSVDGSRDDSTRDEARDRERAEQSRVFELALALDCNDRLLKAKLTTSRALATTLTATASMLEAGELSEYRARRICEKLEGLEPAVARTIEAQVLPTAAKIRLSSLTAKLRRWVLAAAGDDAVAEHLQGKAKRRVTVDSEPSEPGLLGLHAYLPPEITVAIREALEAKAAEFAKSDRAARDQASQDGAEPGERRTKDQRLADALAWFVLGADEDDPARPQRPKIVVQLTMSLVTLLHLRNNAAELPGYGAIPADIARMLAEDADWQRFVHEPVTGHLLDVGDEIYVQPPPMRRFTKARDVKDRFPGSCRSARCGDGDHVKPFDPGKGGPTASANISMLSRVGHVAKTHGGWACEGDANGVLTWTSPRGQTYLTAPHDYREEPEPGDPPPF
jgi:hypothetical protein